jgi:hypothetical protein
MVNIDNLSAMFPNLKRLSTIMSQTYIRASHSAAGRLCLDVDKILLLEDDSIHIIRSGEIYPKDKMKVNDMSNLKSSFKTEPRMMFQSFRISKHAFLEKLLKSPYF